MRCPIHFKDVAKIIEITDDSIVLPANIAVAKGANRQEKREDGLRLLRNHPEINTVVLIDGQREIVERTTQLLSKTVTALGIRRAKTRIFQQGEPVSPRRRMSSYFRARALSTGASKVDEQADAAIQESANIMQTLIDERLQGGDTLLETLMTYVEDYKMRNSPEAYINCHLDAADNFVLREVECLEGSGTVIFNNDDFSINQGVSVDGKNRGTIERTKPNITCWSITTGSSVLIRVPTLEEEFKDTVPAAHAHGLGKRPGEPERRLTLRHNLRF